ncbi:MAG: DnaD domain protein [Chloroflexi bacterium]|nr:DnaD domain protein [Chloroflexota bacterium]
MKRFEGFPPVYRMRYTPLPNLFFSELLPTIDDADELRVTLTFFALLHRRRRFPRCVHERELIGDRALLLGLRQSGRPPVEAAAGGLERAISRGTLLPLPIARNGRAERLIFLNSESERLVIEKIRRGEIAWPEVTVVPEPAPPPPESPNIFTLYEQNVGLLTPMIVEELQDAEQRYPPGWIAEAFREAVTRNRRNWRYVRAILERWSADGLQSIAEIRERSNGKRTRDPGEDGPPDKYIRGRFGHLVRH